MNNMGITESNIIKARSGRYKDTEENRRLHRVGQQYGEKKEKVESGDNVFLKYDLQSLKDASEKMSDKINELENQLKQVSDESDKKGLMEDLSKLKESSAKVLSAISQKEKQGVKFLRGKKVDLSGWDLEELKEGIDDAKQTIEIYKRDLEDATSDEERNKYINRIERMRGRIKEYQAAIDKKLGGDKYDRAEQEFNAKKQYLSSEEGEKAVARIGGELKGLPEGTTISVDGKEYTKNGANHWVSSDGQSLPGGMVVNRILMSKDGDYVVESMSEETLKKIDKDHDEKKDKAEKQGRVYLGEAPNSSKVNLAKYLSAKAKENIDRILGQVIPTKSRAELITMYDDTVKNFNEGFDGMKKAARANMLYQILTIKAALDGKQGDKADIPLASNMSKEEFAEYLASEKGAARKAEIEAKMEVFRQEAMTRMDELENKAVKAFSSMGVGYARIGHGRMELTFGEDGYGGRVTLYGPSRWEPNQEYMVGVASTGAVTPDADGAKAYIAAGKFLSEAKLKKEVLSMMAEYGKIENDVSEKQKQFLKQYPDFSSDGTGVRIE